MKAVISYTTRPPRHGEIDGETYHFVSEEEFLNKKENGFFAETTKYDIDKDNGVTWYYGSAFEDLARDKVMIINPKGLKKIKKNVDLNPVVFYLLSSEENMWNRLRQRGDNSEEARRRLNADDADFANINEYIDYAFRTDLGIEPNTLAEMILCIYLDTIEKIY